MRWESHDYKVREEGGGNDQEEADGEIRKLCFGQQQVGYGYDEREAQQHKYAASR